ncbi:MAG: DUF5685 family protein [Oscillospiraceae bacterium]|jgi:hypothetical protein|nr:DUF5685 family protein [Oscillospiraceae bacterium]
MFGYIKIYKPEMKISEYELYSSVYCGMCRQLGRAFGAFAKLTLNYDFAFLALLGLAINEEPICIERKTCGANPLLRKKCCLVNNSLEYGADIAMLMLFYKLKDNIDDSAFIKKIPLYFLYPFAAAARNKAGKRLPETDALISEAMLRQRSLERENCDNIDAACEPSASALAAVFEALSGNESQKRVLNRLGYLLGRWVYLVDAADDWEKDKKSGGYNILLRKFPEIGDAAAARQKLEFSLNLTLGEIFSVFNLLDTKRFRPILGNIIYTGLPEVQKAVLEGRFRKKEHEGKKTAI